MDLKINKLIFECCLQTFFCIKHEVDYGDILYQYLIPKCRFITTYDFMLGHFTLTSNVVSEGHTDVTSNLNTQGRPFIISHYTDFNPALCLQGKNVSSSLTHHTPFFTTSAFLYYRKDTVIRGASHTHSKKQSS